MQFLGDCREVPEMPKLHPDIMRYKLIKCDNDNAAPGEEFSMQGCREAYYRYARNNFFSRQNLAI
jgi:hypothetical protein